MLKKSASGVLVAPSPQRTSLYASGFPLPAALLGGPFEISCPALVVSLVRSEFSGFLKILSFSKAH